MKTLEEKIIESGIKFKKVYCELNESDVFVVEDVEKYDYDRCEDFCEVMCYDRVYNIIEEDYNGQGFITLFRGLDEICSYRSQNDEDVKEEIFDFIKNFQENN